MASIASAPVTAGRTCQGNTGWFLRSHIPSQGKKSSKKQVGKNSFGRSSPIFKVKPLNPQRKYCTSTPSRKPPTRSQSQSAEHHGASEAAFLYHFCTWLTTSARTFKQRTFNTSKPDTKDPNTRTPWIIIPVLAVLLPTVREGATEASSCGGRWGSWYPRCRWLLWAD